MWKQYMLDYGEMCQTEIFLVLITIPQVNL